MDTTEALRAGSPKAQARIVGVFYLAVIGLGIVTLNLRGGLLVRGDGIATAANIAAHPLVYRLSMLAEVAASLAYLVVVALLFRLMAPAGRQLSALAAGFGLAGCTIGAIAVVPLALPLIGTGGGGGSDALAALYGVGLYGIAYKTALIFFGCYCLLLGMLTMRAAFLPGWIGFLLLLSGLSWLTTGIATYLSPEAARAVGLLALAGGGLGETCFTLWLLVFGVDTKRYPADAVVSA